MSAGLPTTWGFPAQKDFVPPEDALCDFPGQGRGRHHPRQDQRADRARRLAELQRYLRHHQQSLRSRPHAGRLLRRIVGSARRRIWARYRWAPISADRCACPAFHCGIYAHKPTFALVPPRGHIPPPLPPLPFERDLTVIGPMARSAADLSLLLDVIAGPDPIEAGKAYHVALPPPRHGDAQEFSRAADRHRSGDADMPIVRARRSRRLPPTWARPA